MLLLVLFVLLLLLLFFFPLSCALMRVRLCEILPPSKLLYSFRLLAFPSSLYVVQSYTSVYFNSNLCVCVCLCALFIGNLNIKAEFVVLDLQLILGIHDKIKLVGGKSLMILFYSVGFHSSVWFLLRCVFRMFA